MSERGIDPAGEAPKGEAPESKATEIESFLDELEDDFGEFRESGDSRGGRGDELRNASVIDIHRWSDSPEVDALVEGIAVEMKRAGAKAVNDKLKKHLKIVILNLYHRFSIDPEGYVAYSRNSNRYSIPRRYNELGVSYRPMMRAIDGLKRLELIEDVKGFLDRRSGIGRQSRMRATGKLIELMTVKFPVEPKTVGRAEDEEVIILRSKKDEKTKKKERIDYEDTPEIVRMRENLRAYNRVLADAFIDLNLRDDERPKFDLTRKRLYRVFNNGTFEDGGRFYGGWWQEIPSKYRKHIIINDKITAEYDYSGFHIKLLYAMEGIDYQRDPYAYTDESLRDLLKQILLISLNASSKESALKAIRQEIRDSPEKYPKVDDLKKVVDDFLKEHHNDNRKFPRLDGRKFPHPGQVFSKGLGARPVLREWGNGWSP